jgi:hypothetical protein
MDDEQTIENIFKQMPEDDRIKLALLVREVQSMRGDVKQLNGNINKFIEISDRKIDRDVYLSDKTHWEDRYQKAEGRIQKLENQHENWKIAKEAKSEEREKILGLSKGAWITIVQVVQILVLLGYIGSRAA